VKAVVVENLSLEAVFGILRKPLRDVLRMNPPRSERIALIYFPHERVVLSSAVRQGLENLGSAEGQYRIAAGYDFTIEAHELLVSQEFQVCTERGNGWFWTDESYKEITNAKMRLVPPLREESSPFPCPCCGYRIFRGAPGSFEICGICNWEDDPVQLLDPAYAGGANRMCLMEAQENFAKFGACDLSSCGGSRKPGPNECRAVDWRTARSDDLLHARTPASLSGDEAEHFSNWYYWKRQRTEDTR
jgi:hypothetical protein